MPSLHITRVRNIRRAYMLTLLFCMMVMLVGPVERVAAQNDNATTVLVRPVARQRSGDQVQLTESLLLYPISDVKFGLWLEGVPAADRDNFRFNEIDDPAGTHDGDSTYIVTAAIKSYIAGTNKPNIPDNATNITVSITWTVRYETADSFHASWTRLGMNYVYYFGERHVPGTTYTTYTDTWLINPANNMNWTPQAVNTINALGFDSNQATAVHITQAYLQVNYELGPVVSIDVEKLIWDGVDWIDADTPPGPSLAQGTAPQFKFVVTNTGEVDLTNVDLTDNVYGDITLDGFLPAQTSAEYFLTGSWLAGQHTNTATVTGEYNGTTYSDHDDASFYGPTPRLTLAKTASPMIYGSVGDVISYSYLLTNSGDFPLDGPFMVSDDKVIVTCEETPIGLAPGESVGCSGSYSITMDDLILGSVTNTAQGYGFFMGDIISSPIDAETVVGNEAQLGVSLSSCAGMRDRIIAGTALEQTQVTYTGSESILTISGVTAYWTRLNQLSGNVFNLAVDQVVTSDYGFAKYLGVKQLPTDNIKLYDSSCRLITGTISNLQGGTINDSTLSFTFTAVRDLPLGQYFLQVRYDHALLRYQTIGPIYPGIGGVLAHYDFFTRLSDTIASQDSQASHAGGYGGLDLKRK